MRPAPHEPHAAPPPGIGYSRPGSDDGAGPMCAGDGPIWPVVLGTLFLLVLLMLAGNGLYCLIAHHLV